MEGQELNYKNARISCHFPDRTEEEQKERIKTAAERFLKKVMQSKKGKVEHK